MPSNNVAVATSWLLVMGYWWYLMGYYSVDGGSCRLRNPESRCCPGRGMGCAGVDDMIEFMSSRPAAGGHSSSNQHTYTIESSKHNVAKAKRSLPTSKRVDQSSNDGHYSIPIHLEYGMNVDDGRQQQQQEWDEDGSASGTSDDVGVIDSENIIDYDRDMMILAAPNDAIRPKGVTFFVENITEDATTKPDKYKVIFGSVEGGGLARVEQHTDYKHSHPIIQYQIVNDKLPMSMRRFYEVGVRRKRVAAPLCYCDEECSRLMDCCNDYKSVCPIVDCIVGDWSDWSACVANPSKRPETMDKECGIGTKQRSRLIVTDAANGGVACPTLLEQIACYKPCSNPHDVALLVDYERKAARNPGTISRLYYELPKLAERLLSMQTYCVQFTPEWTNPKCQLEMAGIGSDSPIMVISETQSICVECNPVAQLNIGDRCSGDGITGGLTWWTMAGRRQCWGSWRRTSITNNCTCDNVNATIPTGKTIRRFLFV